MIALFAQSAATAMILAAVLWGYRDIACRWPALGVLVGLGILVRAIAGLALFWISSLDLGIVPALHTGDGFWQFASDAESYYYSAVHGSAHGLGTIPEEVISPTYVKTLSMWLTTVGTSPAAGFLLNLVCYVLVCVITVRLFAPLPDRWRDVARLYTVAAVTCSPALIIFGTQALKDTFFLLLAVLVGVGAFFLASSLDPHTPGVRRHMLIGWAVLLTAVYLSAGVRPYYAFAAWCCLGLLFVACGVRGGRALWRRVIATGLATLAAALIVFAAGGGLHARPFVGLVGLDHVTSRATLLLLEARGSYVQSGGGTNVAGPTTRQPEERDDIVADLRSWSPAEHVRAVTLGLAMLFVPVQILRAVGIVAFDGGRGLLLLTDIDTVIFDVTLVAGIVLAVRAWPVLRHNLPYVIFAAAVTLLLTILTAYTVTNYGTLVRLRVLPAITVWMLPLALRLPDRSRAGLKPCDTYGRDRR